MTEPGLVVETLFDEANVVVAGSEVAGPGGNLTPADLVGEPWVLTQPGSLGRSLREEVFQNSGFEPLSTTVLTVSLHLYMRLIETGRWLGLVPLPSCVLATDRCTSRVWRSKCHRLPRRSGSSQSGIAR